MKFQGDMTKLLQGLEELRLVSRAVVTAIPGADHLVISKDTDGCKIEYGTKAEFFRGVTILDGLLRESNEPFHLEQKRNFETCGMMVDVSRNAVLTVESVKKLIVYMAKMGLNMLMLYTEDTYQMEKYPYFGYMRGAYTQEELGEIVDYADRFGIEVIPCIQTLGHLSRALQWDSAGSIKDTEDILLVDEPETYEFIEEMFRTCRSCFKTNRIHIGMDEAFNLGLGRYLSKHGYHPRFELFSRHLIRVLEIAKKYGFRPMIWGDMTYDCPDPEKLKELISPEDVELVYFDYYKVTEAPYEKEIKWFRGMGYEPLFAGGIQTWNTLSVNYEATFTTMDPALKACLNNGVKEVFAALWGDDGTECSMFTSLLGMQLFAEYHYVGEHSKEHLARMFQICTGYDAEAFLQLSTDTFGDVLPEYLVPPTYSAGISKMIFYQDVLQGLVDKNLELFDFKSFYGKQMEKFKTLPVQVGLEYLFDHHGLYLDILYRKCDIGIRLKAAYEKRDTPVLQEIREELTQLVSAYEAFHEDTARIWYQNHKAFGFEVLDFRLAGITARVKRAAQRLQAYLDGAISSIPELEAERLLYSNTETPLPRGCRSWWYHNVLSPCPIKGV